MFVFIGLHLFFLHFSSRSSHDLIVVCPFWFVKCNPYILISLTTFILSEGVCLLFSGPIFMMLVLLPLASPKSSHFRIILIMETSVVVSIMVSSARAFAGLNDPSLFVLLKKASLNLHCSS